MSGVFFDTNVLFYLFDAGAPEKRERARALFEEHAANGELVISTQVLIELYASLTRKGRRDADQALEVVSLLAQERVMSADAPFVERALHLSHEHQLPSWDGLIVQAAIDADCSVLLSEDMHAGLRFGSLTIVNPFALAAHERAAAPKRRPRR
ncbi:MAG TPA: PIN domain-containing protein [Burkholderiaceae bacterium]|jgi:predicted nucleic acid-binding protein|nr:PIN domain-containing protein [Burkholderiaceae bacterium]